VETAVIKSRKENAKVFLPDTTEVKLGY